VPLIDVKIPSLGESITNGGVFGSLLSTPILNAPQRAILGMHAIQERPVAVAGQVVIRTRRT
jgi:2-oxoglutarate dehydrogenase E2 component (dihydrolipoamide succinyltransferase)